MEMGETKMNHQKRCFLAILSIVLVGLAVSTVVVRAAYFAKGEFKDVFVNKADYFASDVLYGISSEQDMTHSFGSAGTTQTVAIRNYDVRTGDFNAFNVTFDVYAWLSGPLTAEKTYSLSANGKTINITTTAKGTLLFTDLQLSGGSRSSVTLTVNYGYGENDDLSAMPGVYLVAVPTAPSQLTAVKLGALLIPTRSEAFSVTGSFEHGQEENIGDYAAFSYQVSAVGNAPENTSIVVKWKSSALTLMTFNGSIDTSAATKIDPDERGFDRQLMLEAQSNHVDTLVFFRTEGADWSEVTGDDPWGALNALVSVEEKKVNP